MAIFKVSAVSLIIFTVIPIPAQINLGVINHENFENTDITG
jgi:hypothetical protein